MLYSAYEPGASVPNVVSIPAADVPAITLRIADQAKMPPASTSTNGTTIRIAANPSTTTQAHPTEPSLLLGSSEIPYARLCRLVGRNPRITRDHQSSVHRPSQHRCCDGRPQLKHRPPSFRALLKSGFKDASLTQAAGPNLTFPRWLKWPRIELDHVLFTPGVRPSQVKSFEIKDTDHLALVATLALR